MNSNDVKQQLVATHPYFQQLLKGSFNNYVDKRGWVLGRWSIIVHIWSTSRARILSTKVAGWSKMGKIVRCITALIISYKSFLLK